MNRLKILVVKFKNSLDAQELSLFRGAVINALGENDNILFHNHKENSFRYSYPLIQYKRINKKAVIVCIAEGTDAIGDLFSSCNFMFRIGLREVQMEVDSVKANQLIVQIWNSMFAYHIRKWMPLNQNNYQEYVQLDSLAERCAYLERILTANILSFAKGVGIHFENQVVCRIDSIDSPRVIEYKDVKMMNFDVEFRSNVSLPDYIGLGKGVSLGHGTVVRKHIHSQNNNEQ